MGSISWLAHQALLCDVEESVTVGQLLTEQGETFLCGDQIVFRVDLLSVPSENYQYMASMYYRYRKCDLEFYKQVNNKLKVPTMNDMNHKAIMEIVEFFHTIGAQYKQEIYLVGGFVRDLARQCDSDDLDFVIVGSPTQFADQVVQESSQSSFHVEILRVHPTFGTMTLCVTSRSSGFSLKVDIATSRTETYAKPADLPVVQAADTIRADISRRDFTINTMAIQISPQYNQFIDLFDGMADLLPRQVKSAIGVWESNHIQNQTLCNGIIRCLHPQSFVDDPTRIFRALRFSVRFGFLVSLSTVHAIVLAIHYHSISALSGGRRLIQLKKVCQIQHPVSVFQAIICAPPEILDVCRVNFLDELFPGFESLDLTWIVNCTNHVAKVPEGAQWKAYVLAMGAAMPDNVYKLALASSFKMDSGTVKELQACRTLQAKFVVSCQKGTDRYSIVQLLERITEYGLCYLYSNPQNTANMIAHLQYFEIDSKFKLKVDGNYLMKIGVPKGKQLSVAKQFMMKECINCPDLLLREELAFQTNQAQTFLQSLQHK